MHHRQRIRQHTKAILQAAIPDMAEKIFTSRAKPVDFQNLPAIVIYTRNEPAEIFSDAPKQYLRKTRLNVEILAAGIDDADDKLDEIAEKVELAIMANEQLSVTTGGTAAGGNIKITGTDGTIIPLGTRLSNGWAAFTTQAAVTIASGQAVVAVLCVAVGVNGNTKPEKPLTLVVPVAGVTGAKVGAGGLVGGVNGTVVHAAARTDLAASDSDFVTEGAQPIGGLAIGFDVSWYQDAPGDLTDALPPLETAHAGWDLAAPDGTLEAEDIIKLPQQ